MNPDVKRIVSENPGRGFRSLAIDPRVDFSIIVAMAGLLIWLVLGVGQGGDVGSLGREMPLEMGMIPEQPVSIDDYVLNAGDTLLILVKGSFSYSYPTQITPTGQLVLMLPSRRSFSTVGQTWGEVSLVNLEAVDYVEVIDLPVRVARTEVAEALERYIRPAQIDFVLLGPRRFKVSVLGDVQWPGSYLATPFMRVEDAVDMAGGITSLGSVTNIQLVRRSGDTSIVNLRKYREQGNVDANLPLNDGDVIFVPKMERFVLVRGAVFAKEVIDEPNLQTQLLTDTTVRQFNAEHWLEFGPGEKVCDFLASRTVLLPQSDLSNCYIIRGEQRIFFDMQSYLTTAECPNPYLRQGDIVMVPRMERFVYITGEVRRGGIAVIYNEVLTLSQYLGHAGGLMYTSDSRAIRIIYPDGRVRRAHPDMVLEPGATIHVPRKPIYGLRDWVAFATAGVVLLGYIIGFGD